MSLPRRVVLACTSAIAPLHQGHNTGIWINEAQHPFNVFRQAGFEVDLVSETGQWGEDWLSVQPDFLTGKDRENYEDRSSEFRTKLDNMLTPDKIDATRYGIFFASAGHAALLEYPDAKGLQDIAIQIWFRGGMVCSVCHGPAIFPGIIDPATGQSVVHGKTFTGFGTQGEEDMGLAATLYKWGKRWVEDVAKALGATYMPAPGPWDAFHVVDGRIVTGTNPASAQETAEAILEVFERL
ncbi:plasma membrane heat shock protein [Elasticomyces elasticus]|uniref:D-lactate dehydratase n=1 Tax=Elasticomyces elasticus TaxID=574655 RepID=A0AAN7WI77_9PEZI|nr:plasma membrane heat shock protein [Elasticomyces elasticus]